MISKERRRSLLTAHRGSYGFRGIWFDARRGVFRAGFAGFEASAAAAASKPKRNRCGCAFMRSIWAGQLVLVPKRSSKATRSLPAAFTPRLAQPDAVHQGGDEREHVWERWLFHLPLRAREGPRSLSCRVLPAPRADADHAGSRQRRAEERWSRGSAWQSPPPTCVCNNCVAHARSPYLVTAGLIYSSIAPTLQCGVVFI
jgi:hypothetical protein